MVPVGTKFLVVDDAAPIRELLKKHLKELGYTEEPLEAEGVDEAMKVMEGQFRAKTPIQFILCDWSMPGKTGLDFLKIIRNSSVFKNIPFLMITAENDINRMIEAANEGATNYQVKPWVKEELKRKMDACWLVYNDEPAKYNRGTVTSTQNSLPSPGGQGKDKPSGK